VLSSDIIPLMGLDERVGVSGESNLIYTYCISCIKSRDGQTAIFGRWTTEMIADQRTGKKSGPALADYRNVAFTIPLFCMFLPIFKNISIRRSYQIMGVDTDTDTDTAE
jgi:hypothetical protein